MGFALVAADDLVILAIAVAIGALQAGPAVNVAVYLPALAVDGCYRVTEQAVAVWRPVAEVDERAVLGVKLALIVADVGRHRILMVVGIRAINLPPAFPYARGHAADVAEAVGSGRGPAEVLACDLFGPLAGVLPRRGAVTGLAVDVHLARDVPAGFGVGELIGRLAPATAREVPAPELRALPGREPEVGRLPSLWPAMARHRDLRPGCRIHPEPRLGGTAQLAGRDIRAEVETAGDSGVVVAGATGLTRGVGGRARQRRHDGVASLVGQHQPVHRRGATPVPHLAPAGRLLGAGRGDQKQQCCSGYGDFQARNSPSLKWSFRACSTASLTRRTATAVS